MKSSVLSRNPVRIRPRRRATRLVTSPGDQAPLAMAEGPGAIVTESIRIFEQRINLDQVAVYVVKQVLPESNGIWKAESGRLALIAASPITQLSPVADPDPLQWPAPTLLAQVLTRDASKLIQRSMVVFLVLR